MHAVFRRRRVLAALVAAEAFAVAATLHLSDIRSSPLGAVLPHVVGLTLGTAQALLLASWLTLGPPSRVKLPSALAFVGCFVVGRRLVDENLMPWPEWLSLVAWWIVAPLVVGLAIGRAMKRRGWRWRDAGEPVGPPVRWTVRHALAAFVAISLFLGAVRWLHTVQAELHFLITGWLHQTGGWLQSETLVNDPFLGACFFASALTALAATIGPRPSWPLAGAALVVAALVGGVAWFALPRDVSSTPGLEALWLYGTLAAALNTLATSLTLRAVGWRIDRPAFETDASATDPSSASAPARE